MTQAGQLGCVAVCLHVGFAAACGGGGSFYDPVTPDPADGGLAPVDAGDAPNTAPTVSDVSDQTTAEDTPLMVAIQVGDAETDPDSLTVTASSANASVVDAAGLSVGGTATNRVLTSGVNDLPTISVIADQTTEEDTAVGPVSSERQSVPHLRSQPRHQPVRVLRHGHHVHRIRQRQLRLRRRRHRRPAQTYLSNIGFSAASLTCYWLGINDPLSISAIGLLGGCTGAGVAHHDDLAIGVGLQSCADANGCGNGGGGHTSGRLLNNISPAGPDHGPWFVLGR